MLDLHNPTPADLQPFFPDVEILEVQAYTRTDVSATAVVDTTVGLCILWEANGCRTALRYTPQPKRGWFRRLIEWMTK